MSGCCLVGAHSLSGNDGCWTGCTRHWETWCRSLPQYKRNPAVLNNSHSRAMSLAWSVCILSTGLSSGKDLGFFGGMTITKRNQWGCLGIFVYHDIHARWALVICCLECIPVVSVLNTKECLVTQYNSPGSLIGVVLQSLYLQEHDQIHGKIIQWIGHRKKFAPHLGTTHAQVA